MEVNGALLEAYRRTTFIADTPSGRVSLRIGQRCNELDDLLVKHRVTTWAYVTAFNPGSRVLPREENLARQGELECVVAANGLTAYSGEGAADDGRWPPEASLLVLGITRTQAVNLGQQFGQIAIVYGEVGKEAQLVVCDEEA
jgi:Protein of unknown function (DUF3293)